MIFGRDHWPFQDCRSWEQSDVFGGRRILFDWEEVVLLAQWEETGIFGAIIIVSLDC